MIVDVSAQVPREKSGWNEFLKAMDSVDKVIVFSGNRSPEDLPESKEGGSQYSVLDVNNRIAEFVRAHSEKLIGFMSVHPHDPRPFEEIERARQDLGLRGITLSPCDQNFDPLDEKVVGFFQHASELGLPIVFSQGSRASQSGNLDWAHPRNMDRLAMACPDLRMVLASFGHPWQIDCITVVRKHPNLYADISLQFCRPWSYYNAFRLAAEWGVMHKLMFASGFPNATPAETIAALWTVNNVVEGTKLPRVPEQAMHEILHRDSLKLLGLA